MTKITPIADDLGKQSLQSDNTATSVAKAVTPVAAAREIHQLAGAPVIQKNLRLQRRHKERRRLDRRSKNTSVMLDTRSHQERRRKHRRNRGASEDHTFCHRGIDIKI
ncbi:MAG: hypothetical protein OEY89_04450 [Gammaproteobacteria bacterium]|nr:hypothetical protein [Gammaproteobacteria bacterium]